MSNFALLKNVGRAVTTVQHLVDREPGLPNIGVLSGPSGFGKTVASIYVQNNFNGIRIEVGESWSRKKLLQAILEELGIQNPRGTISSLADDCKIGLSNDFKRPLLVDEADKLVDKGYIDIIRELAEVSSAPVLLIGEEQLPYKLKQNERVHNRVLQFTLAEPCDAEDTALLAGLYAKDLMIADDLCEEIRTRSQGRARRIAVNLNHVKTLATNEGLMELGLAQYLKLGGIFFTGEAPIRAREPKAA